MSRVLLIGSGNRDKSRELRELLKDTGWVVKDLRDYPEIDEPIEDADTFEGNALLKARYYGDRFKVACVADDSGIQVDALNGAPGVYSARYAGEECSYDDNNEKMLRELTDVADDKRTARFVCCAAYYDPTDGESFTEFGTGEGRIASEQRGANGFGYDPLFIPKDHDRTFGELPPATKHAISHRGEAFGKMAQRLVALSRQAPR